MRIILVYFCFLVALQTQAQWLSDFSLIDVRDGSKLALKEFRSNKALVVIFYSPSCAYCRHYEERIKSLQIQFLPKGVAFLLINSNSNEYAPKDQPEAMKNYLKEINLDIPFLTDPNKVAMAMFKARRTPEAFVLIPSGNKFEIIYRGAIDDNPMTASDVDHTFLKNVLLNLGQHQKDEMQTQLIGCLIK